MVSHPRPLISCQAQHERGHPKPTFTVQFASVDAVIVGIMAQGHGMLMAKFDMASAYTNVVIHPDDCPLFGMQWHG